MDKRRPRKIIADSSAIAAIIMEEPGWEELLKILTENIVYTMDFAWAECANVVWKGKDPNRIDRLRKTMLLIDVFVASSEHIETGLNIALKENIPVYDALFVAAAKKLTAKLLTLDRKQARVARLCGVDTILR